MRHNTPLFKHQTETVDFILPKPNTFVTSTPGTGKTRSLLEVNERTPDKTLVICPKTIMEAAWGNDLDMFYPNIKYGIFDRKYQRVAGYFEKLFKDNEIVIINHEAAATVLEHTQYMIGYDRMILDEFTAVKNRTAQRSKAIEKLSHHFEHKTLLSGSPTPRHLLDIWHPAFILDQGQRLGANYFNFRNAICQPVQKGKFQQFIEWETLPFAVEEVAHILRDITIRHELTDVVEMPDRIYRDIRITMPDSLRKHYEKMKAHALIELQNKDITAVNRAVLGNKLLQIASGSTYDNEGVATLLHNDKYQLVVQLVKERQQSLIFYIWQHQCDELAKELTTKKIEFAIINGKTPQKERGRIVKDYQAGKYQTLLIQPAAAAHGLTLTASTTSIWCSPTFNLEHFLQANYRDYRIGQKKKTEVLMVQYKDTIEQHVYKNLQDKQDSQTRLLEILKT